MMPEIKKDKPWYLQKTNWGLIIYAAGETMMYFPLTVPYATIVKAFGGILAGIGLRSAVSKTINNEAAKK